jgi:hypothetical protein
MSGAWDGKLIPEAEALLRTKVVAGFREGLRMLRNDSEALVISVMEGIGRSCIVPLVKKGCRQYQLNYKELFVYDNAPRDTELWPTTDVLIVRFSPSLANWLKKASLRDCLIERTTAEYVYGWLNDWMSWCSSQQEIISQVLVLSVDVVTTTLHVPSYGRVLNVYHSFATRHTWSIDDEQRIESLYQLD